MEQKCLTQLDRPEGWAILKSARPAETEPITWFHVRRIVGFNLIVFLIVFAVLFSLIARASGYSSEEFREDLPIGGGLCVAVSLAMALFAANIYRRAWNRRARFLSEADDVPES